MYVRKHRIEPLLRHSSVGNGSIPCSNCLDRAEECIVAGNQTWRSQATPLTRTTNVTYALRPFNVGGNYSESCLSTRSSIELLKAPSQGDANTSTLCQEESRYASEVSPSVSSLYAGVHIRCQPVLASDQRHKALN